MGSNQPSEWIRCLTIIFGAIVVVCLSVDELRADIISISTSDPIGTSTRSAANDYVGILSSAAPRQIGGQNVSMNSVPAGEVFQVGDLVGRDLDAFASDRIWEYTLNLPGDAAPGTGLIDIAFAGHAFERSNNNLEGTDEIFWELFLNGSAVAVDSGGPGAGVDFTSFDIALSDPGGATINQAQIVFTVTGFNANNEWFATRGTLSANYSTVPEPVGALFAAMCLVGLSVVRRRR